MSVFIDKGDWTRMLVIFLCYFSRIHIVPEKDKESILYKYFNSTHLCDFFCFFLSDIPARSMFFLSVSGWKRMT